ncbi:uncharacterized protein BXZ73DRAFT_108243 [Epithele typhae]|nr:uncharacterized protein BXZ73DRAFT_108243 [Epithele typhae]KAH9911127.1 hypothetical protein BXZ73DRAFT_108243 [Epithele typhae]
MTRERTADSSGANAAATIAAVLAPNPRPPPQPKPIEGSAAIADKRVSPQVLAPMGPGLTLSKNTETFGKQREQFQDHTPLQIYGLPIAEEEQRRPSFSVDALVDAILTWIVSDDQSLRVVENQAFRNIILLCRNDLRDKDIPKRDTLRARVINTVDKYFGTLGQQLQLRNGTSDGASNNTVAMRALGTMFLIQNPDLTYDEKQRRLFCFAHAITLSSGDAITILESRHGAGVLKQLRDLVNTIRASIKLREVFIKKSAEYSENGLPLQILKDSKTRWTSTKIMVKRAIKLKSALIDLCTTKNTLSQLALSEVQ